MHKEEVISELVNLKLQIAQLRLQEKALYEKLELTSTHPKETLKILEPVMRVKRAYTKQTSKRGPQTYYARKKISDNMKKLWAQRTPEERAAFFAKVRVTRVNRKVGK